MSKENNYDKLAYETVRLEIDMSDSEYRADDFDITVANRDIPSKIVEMEKTMKKCVITVVGKDTVGIIAKVCSYLADNRINILDISQTIVSGYFNMMMIVDMSQPAKPYDDVISDLDNLGDEIGVAIKCQREEIFDMMHRI